MKKEHLHATAVAMVREQGLINLSRRELCARANIPDGSFVHVAGCSFADFVSRLRDEDLEQASGAVVKRRAHPGLRKESILSAAVDLSTVRGYYNVTRDEIADAAGVSMGLVTRYFGSMKQLRRDIMRHAIKDEIPEIIAQGLANGDEHAKKAPTELKEKAAKLLASL